MQMHFGLEALDHPVDGGQRLGKLAVDVPIAAQTLVVRPLARHELAVAEIRQRRVVELHDIDAYLDHRARFAGQDLGQMIHEALDCGVSFAAVIFVPVAHGNQERAGEGKLRNARGVVHEEAGIGGEHRFGYLHPAHHDVAVFCLSLMLVPPDFFKSADAGEKLADVVAAAPFAVADDVDSGQLLQADRKQHHLVKRLPIAVRRQLVATGKQVLHHLRPRQGTDHVRVERRQF